MCHYPSSPRAVMPAARAVIGGVINFITRSDYQGLQMSAFMDAPKPARIFHHETNFGADGRFGCGPIWSRCVFSPEQEDFRILDAIPPSKEEPTATGVYVGGWEDKDGSFYYLRHSGPEHVRR